MKKTSLLAIALLSTMLISITIQAKGLKVLFIGDSITDGNWGGGGGRSSSERSLWDMNHIYGHGFMFLCASHYMSQYPENEYDFYNRGISGNSLYDLEKRWKEDMIDINPDVLSILVGVNDAGNYLRGDKKTPFDFKAWELKYRELLDRALKANPNLKLIIASPFVAPTGKMGEDGQFDDYNRIVVQCISIVKKIADDYQAIYLPYQQMFDQLLKEYPTSHNTYWIWDGVHPTAAGHQRMADMWIQKAEEENLLSTK